MTSKTQEALLRKMIGIIEREGVIHLFDLQDKVGISVSQFNQISAYFKHRYVDEFGWIEYDKKTKTFKWIKQDESLEVIQHENAIPNNAHTKNEE